MSSTAIVLILAVELAAIVGTSAVLLRRGPERSDPAVTLSLVVVVGCLVVLATLVVIVVFALLGNSD